MTKSRARLEVRGLGGLLDGTAHSLAPGETLVVGRSRSCDLSLRKTKAFKRRDDGDSLLAAKQFNRVSRIHCEVEYAGGGEVRIRDLSQNGTLVDGARVGRSHVLKLGGRRATIELVDGTWGKLLVRETVGDDVAA
jgi:pSer/pThr/pTyr-binding forkhead associated (FHA) protein